MNWLLGFVLVIIFIFVLTVFRGAPYLPSQRRNIKLALSKLYPLTENDVLVDVGSGDGVVLREASKIGAHAIGFEINPILVSISRILSKKDNRIEIHFADFWLSHLPDETTVIYIFSVGRDMKKIIKWIQKETNKIGHPVSIISFGFKFPLLSPAKNIGPYYLYIVNPLHQVKPQV